MEVCRNFSTVYANIMNSGKHTWKALSYLKKLKKEEIGFDFRIHLDEDDTPDGLVWMSFTMKNGYFSTVIFSTLMPRKGSIIKWDGRTLVQ